MGVYVRSKFRADVITIITVSQHCIVVSSFQGDFELTKLSPWPGLIAFQWSSASASCEEPNDRLVGPSILCITPTSSAKVFSRNRFRFVCGLANFTWLAFPGHENPSIDWSWLRNSYNACAIRCMNV